MKVRELIAKLQDFDPELDVLGHTEDASNLPEPSGGLPITPWREIIGVDVVRGRKSRREADGAPLFKFEKGPDKLVSLEITRDF